MAEVIDADDGVHRVGHEGIGPQCPVSCLGVRTVGDLLGWLVKAGQGTGLYTEFASAAGVAHEHERVTARCPVECLGLSVHVLNALRNDRRDRARTVGDVLGLLRSRELAEIRNIGPRRVGEVRTALVAAGFPVPASLM